MKEEKKSKEGMDMNMEMNPGMGNMQQMPYMNEMPQMPNMGNMQQMPYMNEMPQMPNMGNMQQMPYMNEMPQMSNMGQMPQMPYMMGQMPQMCCPFIMYAQCPMMYNQGMAGMNSMMQNPHASSPYMNNSMMGSQY